jgi:hypothetical protein
MQRLRLLATSLLAFACVLPAAAQTSTAPPPRGWDSSTITTFDPQTPSTPQALTTKSLPSTFSVTLPQSDLRTAKPNSFHFDSSRDSALTLDSKTLALRSNTQASGAQVQPQDLQLLAQLKAQEAPLAQTTTPCYTLRVYGFTPQDLKSPHPHSSTETDCTPASSAHLKAIQLPGTVNAK